MCGKDTEKNDRTLCCIGCLRWRHSLRRIVQAT
nr:unnamed protein product [Callosobruchus analis]CAI5842289.1 unnamed protein product [Callosobruchus analis]